MSDHNDTLTNATTALLRLIDQRIHGDALNPPFELANIAVDQIATHAIALANELFQDTLNANVAHNPKPPPTPRPPTSSRRPPPTTEYTHQPTIDFVDHPDARHQNPQRTPMPSLTELRLTADTHVQAVIHQMLENENHLPDPELARLAALHVFNLVTIQIGTDFLHHILETATAEAFAYLQKQSLEAARANAKSEPTEPEPKP